MYFKAVEKKDGEFRSISVHGDYCVKYTPWEIARPKIGKLFVFSGLRECMQWLSQYHLDGCGTEIHIFETEVWNPDNKPPRRVPNTHYFSPDKYWEGDKLHPDKDYNWDTPDGTVLVDWLKLTNRLCVFRGLGLD